MSLHEEVTALIPLGERGWVRSIQILAQAMDRREMELERIRVHLGFGEDWSPAYDRKQRTAPNSPIKWAEKFGTVNGMGMIAPFLREMAEGMDLVEEKLAEAHELLRAPCETAARLPKKRGRPTNAERAARQVA